MVGRHRLRLRRAAALAPAGPTRLRRGSGPCRGGAARCGGDRRRVPHRGHLASDPCGRKAAAPRVRDRGGARAQCRRRRARCGHRRDGARRRCGGAGASGLAVPRRRDGRRRDAARHRGGEPPLGQPEGDPGRRLPAGEGVRACGLARHRGGGAAGSHDRAVVRGPGARAAADLRPVPHREPVLLGHPGQDRRAVRHLVPHRRAGGRRRRRDAGAADQLRAVLRDGVPDRGRRAGLGGLRRGARQAVGQ